MHWKTIEAYLEPLIPISWHVAAGLVFGLAIHHDSLLLRLILIGPTIGLSVVSLTKMDYFWYPEGWDSMWGVGMFIFIFHYINAFFIDRVRAPSYQEWAKKKDVPSAGDPLVELWRKSRYYLHSSYKHWNNPQMLGSAGAERKARKASPTQTLASFVGSRLAKLALIYCVNQYILNKHIAPLIATLKLEDFSADTRFILFPTTWRLFWPRLALSLIWAWEGYSNLVATNAAVGLFTVLVGLDHHSEWASPFGSVLDGYSVRRFWGNFWHRLVVTPYGNIAKVICHALCLQPSSAVGKMLNAFVVFAISGLNHSVVCWVNGSSFCMLDTYWYMAQFGAATAETLFLQLLRSLAARWGLGKQLHAVENSLFGRLIGWVWLLWWMMFSIPAWMWPRISEQVQAANSRDAVMARLMGVLSGSN